MVMAMNCANLGGRTGSSMWDSEKEMLKSALKKTNSGASGTTKTSGGANGALHGQLTQQPLGKFGHEGHTGHVGRIESPFGVVAFALAFARTLFEQRPQHCLQFCF
jgi:hypothetical protein